MPGQADNAKKRFECEICNRTFSTKQLKKEHVLLIHQNAGRYKCSYCTKTFEEKRRLEVHERVHKVRLSSVESPRSNGYLTQACS